MCLKHNEIKKGIWPTCTSCYAEQLDRKGKARMKALTYLNVKERP